jgi:hypothetical protein
MKLVSIRTRYGGPSWVLYLKKRAEGVLSLNHWSVGECNNGTKSGVRTETCGEGPQAGRPATPNQTKSNAGYNTYTCLTSSFFFFDVPASFL